MGIRITVIGAGSRSFGPRMIRDILLSQELCDTGVELVLMDTVPDHLPENENYAHHVMERLNRKIKVTKTTQLEEALKGADFVVCAFEADRYLYWSQDFHIPRKYGFKQIYGENGGPGSIFHALRNMGPLMHIAEMMSKLCPQAPMLNFSNPEHKLCEAVNRLTGIQVIGLCHGYFMGKHQISKILGLPDADIIGRACGMNHFTFFQSLQNKKTGEDLYPQLAEVEKRTRWTSEWHELALGRTLFRLFGLWPSPGTNHYGEYMSWANEFMASQLHFYYDAQEGAPWETKNIPDFVYTIDRAQTAPAWQSLPEKDNSHTQHKLDSGSTDILVSDEMAVPIIEGMVFNKVRELEAVNIRNRGAIPNLPDDMVVEVPAICDKAGVKAVQMAALPEAIAALIRTQGSINKILVEAFAEKSKHKLLQAILLEPTVDSYKQAVLMMNEMLELQKAVLPELK